MKILIVYACGRDGARTTEKAAHQLASNFEQVTLVDIANETVNPSEFDIVVVGSPVYDHRFEKPVKAFLAKYEADLLTKSFAFFISLVEYETLTKVVTREIPVSLRNHAFTFENVGGEIVLDNLGWYDKILARSMMKNEGKKHEIELMRESFEELTKKIKDEMERI
ncbi:flavodoxin domain-containing protein [Lactococcus nasutitermitis]|uniref:Flavodoxin domain-containing protein n=1 Tax=Lactococcus nasutitermitis TaxID=1652957 RepID=A0ABV9JFJ3_9LACT|nr:flavodoxin domain-containing protein [Lactococcus nasutitermitis]